MVNEQQKQTRLAFIVAEDWFFVSHFLPMLRAAKTADLEVAVITRTGAHKHMIEELGARVIPLDIERSQLGLWSLSHAIIRIAHILRREKIDLVHCIGIRCVVTGGAAAMIAGVNGRVFAITGGGLMAADNSVKARIARFLVAKFLRVACVRGRNHFLFENASDKDLFGLGGAGTAATVVGGAGVDPAFYRGLPQPSTDGVKLAMVGRMVWSKGVDIAVKAVSIARQNGHNVSLTLFGNPDPSNPRSLSTETLREWSLLPGIEWRGPISDVRKVWAEHNICILPTRGGEGLPRSILEAAACARPILTTNVPGCRDFVRDSVEGWLFPIDDAAGMAQLLSSLAYDKERIAGAGARARQRVNQGYTEARVSETVRNIYRDLL